MVIAHKTGFGRSYACFSGCVYAAILPRSSGNERFPHDLEDSTMLDRLTSAARAGPPAPRIATPHDFALALRLSLFHQCGLQSLPSGIKGPLALCWGRLSWPCGVVYPFPQRCGCQVLKKPMEGFSGGV
jgi:hypothetical protein